MASIKTRRAMEGRRRFKGVLRGVKSNEVVLATADGTTVAIPADLIERANLVYEMEPLGKKPGVR